MPNSAPLPALLAKSALLGTALLVSLVEPPGLINASAAEPQARAATPNHDEAAGHGHH